MVQLSLSLTSRRSGGRHDGRGGPVRGRRQEAVHADDSDDEQGAEEKEP
jgi:hypothetical protein